MPDPCPVAARLALAWYAAAARIAPAFDGARLAPDALAEVKQDAARPEVVQARRAYSAHLSECASCRARVAELAAIAVVSTDGESEKESEVGGHDESDF